MDSLNRSPSSLAPHFSVAVIPQKEQDAWMYDAKRFLRACWLERQADQHLKHALEFGSQKRAQRAAHFLEVVHAHVLNLSQSVTLYSDWT